jgi:hypothetical protein
MEMLARMEPEAPQRIREDFIEPLMQEPIHGCADNQFAYRVIHTNRLFVSVWAVLFYGVLPFIGFTGPKVNVPAGQLKEAPISGRKGDATTQLI